MISTSRSGTPRKRVVFIANTMYSSTVSGGEVHTLNLARETVRAGYDVHFMCGNALRAELEKRNLPVTMTLTDSGVLPPYDFSSLSGQLRLLMDYFRRLRGSLAQLSQIQASDLVYCTTEMWWDYIPGKLSKSDRKIVYVGMDSPSLREIAAASRPDVKRIRLPSLHYWLAQQYALRSFRNVVPKRLTYAHQNQKARLASKGYTENELHFVGNGVDLKQALVIPPQDKIYDAVWVGRPHKQKGVDDLLSVLSHLASKVEGFRAMLIGNLEQILGPAIKERGLSQHVSFSGYVSEPEKFRLLKSSRVFLMPSKYESWGIVIGEALVSGNNVVAYDLEAYRPIFGDLVRYVPCFDCEAFCQAALESVMDHRQGRPQHNTSQVDQFVRENSWEVVGTRFVNAVQNLFEQPRT